MSLILILCLGISAGMRAQTDPTNPQLLCTATIEAYQVDFTEGGGAGTPGSTYAWTVTGPGFAGTVNLNQGPAGSSNRITVNWGSTPPGSYTITVTETNNGCAGTPSVLTVILSPPPTASAVPVTPICSGADAVFTITGPANATVTYTVNGTPGSLVLNGSGSGQVIVTGATADQTLNLLTVDNGICSNILTETDVVTISPLLTVIVTAPTPICDNTTATFTISGPAGATVNYTLNGNAGSIVLNGSGQGTVTVNNVTSVQNLVLVSVSNGTCSNPVTGNATVSTLPPLTATINALTPICNGANAVFNVNGPANATVNYTLNSIPGSVVLNAGGTGTITAASATSTQTVILTSISDGTCTNPLTGTQVVTIQPLLTATVTANSPVCNGEDAIVIFTGPAGGVVSYTLNGTPANVNLDGAGNGSFTITGVTATQNIALSTVSDGVCTNPVSGTATITLFPPLTATVTAPTPICSGTDAVFTINGPAGGSVTYTLNGSPNSVVLNGSGVATVTFTGATTTQTLQLLTVTNGTCTDDITLSATVTINSLLTASVSGNGPICSGDDAIFTITGPANGTVDYTLNGVPGSVALDGSGSGTVTSTGATTAQNIQLTNVSNGTCGNPINVPASITILPLPTASVNAVSPICNNTTAVFSFTGTPNATVSYTINGVPGSVVLNGSGTATVSVNNVTVAQNLVLVSATEGSCTGPLTGGANVVPDPPLTASVTGTTPICNGGNASFTITGTPNATIDYTINGAPGSVTLNGAGSGTVNVPTVTVDQVISLISASLGTCSNPVSGGFTVVVSPLLTATVSSTSPICSGSSATFSITGTPNATVSYTINGVPGSVVLNGSGSGAVTVANATADQTLALTSISNGTCTNPVSGSSTVTINTLLIATVAVTSPICENENAVFTVNGPAGATVTYNLNGTPASVVLNGSGVGTITVTGATTNQTVDLLTVDNGSCSNSVTDSETIIVNPLPTTSTIFHD
jgi:hypothetical protein